MSEKNFGVIASPSSSSVVKVLARNDAAQTAVVGRMVFFDVQMSDGVYRAVATVGNVSTENNTLNDSALLSTIIRGVGEHVKGVDMRTSSVVVQSVYRKATGEDEWKQYGSALPTSPSTLLSVNLLDEEDIDELIPSAGDIVYIGRFRGLDAFAPMNLPNFSSKRGAVHTGIIGRSGSGKTALSTFVLGGQMKHENHAIILIDPQGQWNTENGFVFSLKKFAEGLGREVSSLRVSEDIRLTMDESLLAELMTHVNLWSNFRRMGRENQEALSREIATQIANRTMRPGHSEELEDPRGILLKVMGKISQSRASLDRIYARGETQDALQRDLAVMSNQDAWGPMSRDGDVDMVTPEEVLEGEARIEKILDKFSPIINLFAKKNFTGGTRRSLRGHNGFLTHVLQSRADIPDVPAPYVILDMSSDTTNAARGAYAAGMARKSDDDTEELDQVRAMSRMRALLDNSDIKARIITSVLTEIKEASEEAFAIGGGNLNTQVVFDEAWRYAPPINNIGRDTPIGELSAMLEGFALDTRKYGIGWTYILQSPSDLNRGIWRQLSFVYSGYGIQGGDKRMMEDLMDDTTQMALYNQFASPASTGLYPFMINGPVSPLIFTNTPTFINVFSDLNDFLGANARWIDGITQRLSLPYLSRRADELSLIGGSSKSFSTARNNARNASIGVSKAYAVGGTSTARKPTVVTPPVSAPTPSTKKNYDPPF